MFTLQSSHKQINKKRKIIHVSLLDQKEKAQHKANEKHWPMYLTVKRITTQLKLQFPLIFVCKQKGRWMACSEPNPLKSTKNFQMVKPTKLTSARVEKE